MTVLPRQLPDPIPAIHPLPEYLAEGERKRWYEEMKHALQVPWMGVVTMAFAHYPSFFAALWQGTGVLVASRAFVHECRDLRQAVEAQIAALAPSPLSERLRDAGYAERELGQIREVIEVFSHGNFPYLLIATLTRLLLEGHDPEGGAASPPFEGRHAPDVRVPFVLMEAHHADAPTRAVYGDVMTTLGLPFVNTDYRALARWPSYFALAWGDLREVVTDPRHAAICDHVHERAIGAVMQALPKPRGLDAAALQAAARKDAPLEEVQRVAGLFQWLLPGLVTNVAYLRAQLQA